MLPEARAGGRDRRRRHGLLDPLPPREARRGRTRVLVEQYQLTHGSTWHSRRARRPAALVDLADADDAVLRRPLRRAEGADGQRPGLAPARRAAARVVAAARSRRSAARRRGRRRSACRWRSSAPQEAQETLPADVDRRRARRRVHPRRRLPRPEPADVLARRRRAPARRARSRRARASPAIETTRRPRRRRRDRPGARSSARSSSTPPACTRRRSRGWSASTLPIIPYGHQYLITEPFEPAARAAADAARSRQPRLLPHRGRRPRDGRLRAQAGAVGARRHPGRLRGEAPAQEWERMEELFANAIARVPAMENAEVKMFFNGPEAFTPDADFLLGETEVPGLLGRRGRLRARARRARAASARSWASGSSTAARSGTSGRSTCAASAASTGARRTRSRARTRRSRSTTTSSTRARRSSPAGRCASRRRTRGTARSARVRREGRLGARQLVRVERRAAATSRCARAAGRARTGRRRSRSRRAPRARRAALFDQSIVLEDRGARARRARVPRAAVREHGSTGPSARSSTRSC